MIRCIETGVVRVGPRETWERLMTQADERRAQQARYAAGLARVRWTQEWLALECQLAAWPVLPRPVSGMRILLLTEQQCAPLVEWMAATGLGPEVPPALLGRLTTRWPWLRRAVLVPPQLIVQA